VWGLWTPLPLRLLSRALHPKTLPSPACLCRYSPYTRRETPVIEFSRFEASVLFRMSIVKKRRVARDRNSEWVVIVLQSTAGRTRLTEVVVQNEPLCRSEVGDEVERLSLSVRSPAGSASASHGYHLLLYTKSRNSQLSLLLYQLVNLSLESYIRHFDLKYIRDEFCPSCLQSRQLCSKRGLS